MVLHNCKLSDDCYRCQVPFCPYEKLDDGSDSGWDDGEDEDVEVDDDPELPF